MESNIAVIGLANNIENTNISLVGVEVDTSIYDEYILVVGDTDISRVEIYKLVYKLIRNGKKLRFVDVGADDELYKFIVMFMVSNGNYEIYKTDISILDSEYIDNLSKISSSISDLSMYLDGNLDEYDGIIESLVELDNAIRSGDVDNILAVIESNKSRLSKSLDTISILRVYIETLGIDIIDMESIKSAQFDVEEKYRESLVLKEAELNERDTEIERLKLLVDSLDGENSQFKAQLEDMRNTIESQIVELESCKEAVEVEKSELVEYDEGRMNSLIEENEVLNREIEESKNSLNSALKEKEDIQKELDELVNKIDLMEKPTEDLGQIDSLNAELDIIQEALDDSTNKLNKELEKSELLSKRVEEKDAEIHNLKTQYAKINAINEELITKMNDKSPTIQTFRPIILQTTTNRTKNILYIKEISYVTYINSLVVNMMQYLKGNDFNKVKLVIYDNKSDFNIMYRDIATVTGADYNSRKDIILNQSDKIAVLDYSTHILEDILKQENDLVIVYDRLKSIKDLVQGSDVVKYYACGSRSHIDNMISILGKDVNPETIITRPGVMKSTIALARIDKYGGSSTSSKMLKWIQMRSKNMIDRPVEENPSIIASILEKSGLHIEKVR